MQNNRTQKGIKVVVIAIAAIIYAVAVIYGDIMFLQIINRVFPSGFLGTLAMLGAFVAGGTALLLPIALHWWHAQGTQQVVGYLFYSVDFAMLALNSMLAYKVLGNQSLDQFFGAWLQVTPATPLICAVGWGLVFSLDVSHKARHAQENLHADLHETYAQRLTNAANSPQVQAIIDSAAQEHARQTVQRILGVVGEQPRLVEGSVVQPAQLSQSVSLPQPAALQQPQKGFFGRMTDFFKGDQQPSTDVADLQRQIAHLQQQIQTSVQIPKEPETSPLVVPVSLSQEGQVAMPEAPQNNLNGHQQ